MRANCLSVLLSVAAASAVCLFSTPVRAQVVTAEGFQVELVYQPPEIEHPSVVTCDDDGNLFVGEDPMDMRGPTTEHFDRVILIRWDKQTGKPVRTVFCDKLGAVFGLVWHDDALYVMHAPLYSVFRDTDGDGVADERKDLAEGFGPPAGVYGFNDHIVTGTRMGMDGNIYVSVGDKGIPKATGADGSTITLEGGGVVRMRPNGTRLEVVTSGTRNHLDVAMDSLDNIFTYDNTDDGLGWWTRFTHHVPTGYYGYPYDYHPHPDRHLPRISEHGGGSPVGAACYTEAAWPMKYRDAAFHCEWGKGKIQVFYPKRDGASFTATMEDFMLKDPSNPEEFRPQDLCFSPDGKHMYVADWNFGGWTNKKICGRLYRVTYVGGDVEAEPARAKNSDPIAAQIKSLGHPAHSERMRAKWAIGRQAQDAKAAANVSQELATLLTKRDLNKWTKIHGIWALNDVAERMQGLDASPLYHVLAMQGDDADVRAQAARAIGTRAGLGNSPFAKVNGDALKQVLKDRDASVRMYAAISLGRLGDAANANSLFAALSEQDVYARFTMVQALRALNNWNDAKQYLDSDNETQRAAVVLALTNQYSDDAVAALAWAVDNAKHVDTRAAAVTAIAEVHRKADPYEKGWWGTQPARGKPSRPKVHEWSGTSTVLSTVRGALKHKDDAVRQAAMKAIIDLNDPQAIPIVTQMALDGAASASLRTDALKTLLASKADSGSKVAAEIVTADNTPVPLLGEALDALRSLADKQTIPAIEKRLSHDDVAVRSKAIEAMAAAAGSDASEAISKALADISATVKKTAIRVAGEAGLRQLIPQLIDISSQTDYEFEATTALAAMPDARAAGVYIQALNTKNNDLRTKARQALISIKAAIGDDIVERHRRNELSPEQRRELQGVFSAPSPIREWLIVGSFSKERHEPRFDPATAADLNQTFEEDGRKMQWKRIVASDENGKVSPGQHVKPESGVWSLAYAEIEASVDQQSELVIGSDDQARVWLNGEVVYRFDNNRGYNPEADRAPIKLKKGTNRIYLLCGNDGGGWEFSLALRLKDPQYAFLYEDTPPQLDTSAYRAYALGNAGSPERGKTMFFDIKGVGCVKCHAVGDQGAKVGPNLAGVGSKYPREELVRSILEPSARVAESFQVTVVLTSEGKVVQGLIKTDTPDTLELIDAEGKTISIAADDIDQRKTSNLSLMPNGLKDGLSLADFADIVSYLESLKENK